MIGSRELPKKVVAPVPTTTPLSFAPFDYAKIAAWKVRKRNLAIRGCPGKRRASVAAQRSTYCDRALRNSEALRVIPFLDDTNIKDLILRRSSKDDATVQQTEAREDRHGESGTT